MSSNVLFAMPWWVNLLAFIPIVPYLMSIKGNVRVSAKQLLLTALFGAAFGFVEAVVVVYLRVAAGIWPSPPAQSIFSLPANLIRIESFREAATMIMLGAIAWLVGRSVGERVVAFLWTFAFWDAFYYVWLRLTIGWPTSLLNTDLLFLIPKPWIAQVWFPILVSSLTALVIWFRCSKSHS